MKLRTIFGAMATWSQNEMEASFVSESNRCPSNHHHIRFAEGSFPNIDHSVPNQASALRADHFALDPRQTQLHDNAFHSNYGSAPYKSRNFPAQPHNA